MSKLKTPSEIESMINEIGSLYKTEKEPFVDKIWAMSILGVKSWNGLKNMMFNEGLKYRVYNNRYSFRISEIYAFAKAREEVKQVG